MLAVAGISCIDSLVSAEVREGGVGEEGEVMVRETDEERSSCFTLLPSSPLAVIEAFCFQVVV